MPVYAATTTATISNGYIYIPSSICPASALARVYRAATAMYYSDDDGGYMGYSSCPGWYDVFLPSSPGTEDYYDTGMRGFRTPWTFSYSTEETIAGYYRCFIINGSPVVDGNYLRYPLKGMITSDPWYPNFYYEGYMTTSGYPSSVNIEIESNSSHSFPSGYTSAATCTAAATKKCTRCGAVQSVGSALGHSPGAAATCTTPQKCTRCGTTLKNALGHNWQTATLSNNNGIKIQPDVYTDGTYYQKCSRCSTGHSGDPYTNHFNVVPGSKLNFQIYSGASRINKIYLGNALIMNSYNGNTTLVK